MKNYPRPKDTFININDWLPVRRVALRIRVSEQAVYDRAVKKPEQLIINSIFDVNVVHVDYVRQWEQERQTAQVAGKSFRGPVSSKHHTTNQADI